MPWEARTVEEKRRAFIEAAEQGEQTISELCRAYGISRKTGYKWLHRAHNGEPLQNRSHRPRSSPNKTSPEVEARILVAREAHPAWGPRKLKRVMENQGDEGLPSKSTFGLILQRNGCIDPEETRKRLPCKRFERGQPNELWQTDFKGHFAMKDGARCHPLTVLDDYSRFALCLEAMPDEQRGRVVAAFQRLFRTYGLPDAILCDNGLPWGTTGKSGFTQIETWLLKLGVRMLHGRPRHPQTQGKEERFHRTIQAELLNQVTLDNLVDAQIHFDYYLEQYNRFRPHEALDMDVPAARYRPSARVFPETLPRPEYPDGSILRTVNVRGYLQFQRQYFYLSEGFRHEEVALLQRDDSLRVLFYGFEVAYFDLAVPQCSRSGRGHHARGMSRTSLAAWYRGWSGRYAAHVPTSPAAQASGNGAPCCSVNNQ